MQGILLLPKEIVVDSVIRDHVSLLRCPKLTMDKMALRV